MTEEKKQELKQRLLEMKEEAEQQMEEYKNDRTKEDYPNDSTGEISSVADHPGDLGTDQFERSKEQTFYEQAREKLMDAEDALQRMEEGTYGKSEKSGKPIPEERLEVMPAARYTIEEQEEMEKEK
ncbi:TraR/DksA C4-type zinc finger protein [Halobacillus sp. ACCC02827]|uniref:TraR/DksA C4-type zinc finger protein n=1 Tax=Bacillaceae TaxID=186817 RepID=UPI0004189CB2|nr:MULTISPECIES: TraR/DksA C4-type zinc finger protein [Bacillaceae]WJE14716.1 TraR/DksA C4-type zinc finger protein [Halobacillus sp. ACCC02827]